MKRLQPAKERQRAKALTLTHSWNPLRWSWLRLSLRRANLEPTTRHINTGLYVLSHFSKQVASLHAGGLHFSLKLGDVGVNQARDFQLYLSKSASNLLDLPDDTDQICCHTRAFNRFRAIFKFLQDLPHLVYIAS